MPDYKALLGVSGPLGGLAGLQTKASAYYSLANLTDATGRGNTLTNNGVATFAAGKVGNAVNLVRASTQFLSRADCADLSLSGGNLTICAWVKLATVDAAYQSIVSKWRYGTSNSEYQLIYQGDVNMWAFYVSKDGTASAFVFGYVPGVPTAGIWYFLCAWYDGAKLYLSVNDGAADSANYVDGVYDGASTFCLGASNWSAAPAYDSYVDGMIDEVGIFKGYALTAGERSFLYNTGTGRTWAELAASP